MKKTIIILISILIAVYVILTMLGSGGEYAAEKLFYRAMKTNSKIMANPDVVPPKLLKDVENSLKKVVEKYPKAESAKAADITLTEFYIYNKRYDDALSRADSIIKKYDKNTALLSTAHFLKARSYEKKDQWAKALKEFEVLRDDYTNTQLGLRSPLYVADYYSEKGRDTDARQAYNEAVQFYKKIEKENSKSMLGYAASTLTLQAYLNMGDYEQAGSFLEETVNKYMSPMAIMQLLPQAENIFVIKLNKPEKAIELYKSIIEKVKDGKLKKVLQKRIDQLSDKKGSVSVSKS